MHLKMTSRLAKPVPHADESALGSLGLQSTRFLLDPNEGLRARVRTSWDQLTESSDGAAPP